MPVKLKEWDPAEWLDDQEMINAYLQESFESGDMREISQALSDVARARNITELAAKMEMSRQELYKTLSENGNPEFSTLNKLVNALGLKISIVAPSKKPVQPIA
jgi:probable addiction module antidote protein